MSGGGQTTTTVANSDPWSKAQPYLEKNMKNAEQLVGTGVGFQPYQGSLVTPFSQQTQQGLSAMEALAKGMGGSGQNSLTTQMRNIVAGGGFNDEQANAANTYQQMVNSLMPTATGNFSGDPVFQANLKKAQEDASNAVNLSASGAGRYGSGVHQQTLANTIGDITNKAMMEKQAQSADQLSGFANSLFNAGQTGFQNMGQAYQQALAPHQTLTNIGGQYENLNTNLLNDQYRKWSETQAAPKNAVEWLNSIYTGSGQLGGTQTSTAKSPQNWGEALLGYGLQGLGGLISPF